MPTSRKPILGKPKVRMIPKPKEKQKVKESKKK